MTSQFADILQEAGDCWLEQLDLQALGLPEDPEPEPRQLPEGAVRIEPWRLWLPGGLSRPGGTAGAGFAAGQVAEGIPPGEMLAGLTASAWEEHGRVSDDELIGILSAWRRLASWAAAGELAAVAELAARREAQVAAGADPHIAEHIGDEVAAALTLTSRAADQLVSLALDLARLPATAAALAAGRIDRARAAAIAEETACLSGEHAAAVEAAVIGNAPRLTSSQVRAAAKRAALKMDPAAAARRRKEALQRARVEAWDEQSGTAAIAGRDLPPADVLAADRRIDTLARQFRQHGAPGTLDSLRARIYTALLLGVPLAVLHAQLIPAASEHEGAQATPGTAPGENRPGTGGADAGDWDDEGEAGITGSLSTGVPGLAITDSLSASVPELALAGSINLTMPLSTWLGGDAPGEADGYWTLPAAEIRSLAGQLAARPGTRVCLTLTGPGGQAAAHGCTRIRPSGPRGTPGPGDRPPELTFTIRPFTGDPCLHEHEKPGYQPSSLIRHRVQIRHGRCSYPGCGRRATRCDLDHTTPYDQGGRTCECNLAPLCRRHHRAKQAGGWALEQAGSGALIWTLPHGRAYRSEPAPYPAEGSGTG